MSSLFGNSVIENILPYDGVVTDYGKVIDEAESLRYYNYLYHHIAWEHDEAIMFGKRIVTKRKVAWYGAANYSYTYSNVTKYALAWTKELLALKMLVEELTCSTYNSCLLNLYHTGEEGMAWHSDDEKALAENGVIASLSFGANRRFLFKHKTTQHKVALQLEAGSLLAMKGSTQKHWLHRLPPTKKVATPRINLTFRTMV